MFRLKYILGPLIGGILGFIYYKLVGCSSGACMLTSNPWVTTLYGSLIGFILVFNPEKKKHESI